MYEPHGRHNDHIARNNSISRKRMNYYRKGIYSQFSSSGLRADISFYHWLVGNKRSGSRTSILSNVGADRNLSSFRALQHGALKLNSEISAVDMATNSIFFFRSLNTCVCAACHMKDMQLFRWHVTDSDTSFYINSTCEQQPKRDISYQRRMTPKGQ